MGQGWIPGDRMTLHPESVRRAMKDKSLEAEISIRCPLCQAVGRVPANVSYSLCPCGGILREPKEIK